MTRPQDSMAPQHRAEGPGRGEMRMAGEVPGEFYGDIPGEVPRELPGQFPGQISFQSGLRTSQDHPAPGPGTCRPPLSLYVHIPWCVRKCPYCDFNSHSPRGAIPEAAYVAALLRDLDLELASRGPAVQPLVSIFIGGGTPSLFSGAAMSRLLTGIRQRLPLTAAAEISLEANPGTADSANFAQYQEAGINRLSLGVQSLNDDTLQALGRIHGPGEARQAVRLARQAGFDNLNLDLMYGLPQQDLGQARDDLREALDLAPEHLSYYQLTLEPHTPFHATPPPLPDEDLTAEMQLQGQELLVSQGFTSYEVAAHARPGRQCQHNLNYWTFGDYLGIGAGAHGKLTDPITGRIQRRAKPRQPSAYLTAVATAGPQGPPPGTAWSLREDEVVLEFVMNSLRLTAGFPLQLFALRTGRAPGALAAPLTAAQRAGLLTVKDDWVRPTELGGRFLNDLVALFMAT